MKKNNNLLRGIQVYLGIIWYIMLIFHTCSLLQVTALSNPSSASDRNKASTSSPFQNLQSFFKDLTSNQQNNSQQKLEYNLSRPTDAMLEKIHFLILPGFGNASQDYTMPRSLVPTLLSRGWSNANVSVLPVERSDWLQVFLCGCLDLQFWKGDAAPTRPAFRWYLQKVAREVKRIKSDCGEGIKVVLVGHSAGGWLARASIGYGDTSLYPSKSTFDVDVQLNKNDIIGIVSLGAPHLPPPSEQMDMTRGALRTVDELFPASYHLTSGIFYVTVAGTAIRGEEQIRQSFTEQTTATGFAYNSYKAVCGDGNAIGDGVVPLQASHLEDATQITLDNCYHSINAIEQWYGSDLFLDRWHKVLLSELQYSFSRK